MAARRRSPGAEMIAARVICRPPARAAIAAHAAAAWPREACGLLVGRALADGAIEIVRAEAAANLAADADAFELDPAARLALQRVLRAAGEGLAIVGHYHSHPDAPARPSARDRARAEETGLIWLIAAATREGCADLGAFVAAPGPELLPLPLA